MEKDRLLLVLAILSIAVAVVAVVSTYFFVEKLSKGISGYATTTSTADVNLTVETFAVINFTTNVINWGSGRVNSGATTAQLNSYATSNVTGGNWTLQTAGGLRLQNIGNVNLTLNLSSSKTAATFIGGTSPFFQWNVSNQEADSCMNGTGISSTGANVGLNVDRHYEVNTTTTLFCNIFQYIDNKDTVRIDFNLTIPSDSRTGALTAVVTATGDTTLVP